MENKNFQESKIIVVSNRLPVSVSKKNKGFKFQQSPGGLATGLRSLKQKKKTIFIGWPGYTTSKEKEKDIIEEKLKEEHSCYPVFLTNNELEKYYYGFSNKTLWPLFHYFSAEPTFEESEWETYKKVNQKFFKKVMEIGGPQDIYWVHDYHLMLLPRLIRKGLPQSAIGFFLHIPFPSSEIFRILPWRTEVIEGLLGADLIGFHAYEYARHFLSSALRLRGYEHELGSIRVDNRVVKVENFPLGIDVKQFKELLEQDRIEKQIQEFGERIDAQNKRIILSVDRLDYTKGIPHRLKGFEHFLKNYPKWHGKVVYLMLCVPSRTQVRAYSQLKEEVDRLVGEINGRFGTPGWMPVYYMYRSLPLEKLLPLYSISDIALVTPVRDGMNLVAKEFVASRRDHTGVLILSETAGAVAELGEAITINVNSKKEIAQALNQALKMNQKEQKKRIKAMEKRLWDYDVYKWTQSFIDRIKDVKNIQSQREHRKLNENLKKKLVSDYKKGDQRLLILDYDGTLISFSSRPEQAQPDRELLRILIALAKNSQNTLVIISGRDRLTMERWLGDIPCSMVAEHGGWLRKKPDSKWEMLQPLSTEWKEQLKPILKTYEVRVPGSLVEEKEYALAWHYRKSDPELGEIKSCELFDHLSEFLANTDLQVTHGNKVVEVRASGIDKGNGVKFFLRQKNWGFCLAMGDDWTDEDLFKVLPPKAYSIKVGFGPTQAKYHLESPKSCRNLLRRLSKK